MQSISCQVLVRVVAFTAGVMLMPSISQASNCGYDFQHAYEKGVDDGRLDGAHKKSNDPTRHKKHVLRKVDKGKPRAECYVEGYNIGYQNAYADARKSHSGRGAPEDGTNERAYYDDGCDAGTRDAQDGMSKAYDRHNHDYDSRFERYFRHGYNSCWNHYR